MLHRVVAAGVAILVALALWECWRTGDSGLRAFSAGTAAILAVQAGLGVTNVLLGLPLWSRGLHLTVAAVLWAAVILLATAIWRGWWAAAASAEAAVAHGRAV
jgi:heme A synthase